jgi:methionyl-tRNA formyltransferase
MRIKFFGNRRFVLEELLLRTSNVEINVIANTHLARDPCLNGRNYNLIGSAREAVESICRDDFDLLISNGLPYILKLENLPKRKYVNIHPSFLPDLRGVDPVLAAILYCRDSGATCHLIDEGIDTGPIISRVKIPFTDDLTATLLYQLSFFAEKKAFIDAWDRDFLPLGISPDISDTIYFTRKSDTNIIPLSLGNLEISQTVKAFSNKNQGTRFFIDGIELRCFSCWFSSNQFLTDIFSSKKMNEVVFVYEDIIIIKRKKDFLFLSQIATTSQEWIGKTIVGR